MENSFFEYVEFEIPKERSNSGICGSGYYRMSILSFGILKLWSRDFLETVDSDE